MSTGKTNFMIQKIFTNCYKSDTAPKSDSVIFIYGAVGGALFLVLLLGIVFYAKKKTKKSKIESYRKPESHGKR